MSAHASSSHPQPPAPPSDLQREEWYRRDRELLRLSQREPRESVVQGQRWLDEVTPGSEAEAWAVRAYSHPLRAVGNYAESLACAERAERQFAQLDLPFEVARTAAGHVWTLRYLGRYAEAIRRAQRARRFFRSRGELLEAARLTNNLGTLYRPLGRLESARRCYVEAARDFRRCGDATEEATASSNLGNVLADLGRYGEAEWAHHRAVRIYRRLGLTAQLARAQLNLGTVLKRLGAYGRALATLNESRDRATGLGIGQAVAQADIELAQTYLLLNLQGEADEAIRNARLGFEQLGLPSELGETLLWSAAIAERRGDRTAASDYLARAADMFQRNGQRLWAAAATVLGAGLGEANDAAITAVAAAERRLGRLGARDRAAEARLVRADLLHQLDRDPEALGEYRAAARAIRRIGSLELAYRASASLGRQLEATAPGRALGHYRAAIDQLETLRRRARADDLKLSLIADKVDVYERATHLILARGSGRAPAAEALAMVERGKSPGLVDDLLARADHSGRAASAAARRLRDARAALAEAGERSTATGRSADSNRWGGVAELELAVTVATRDLQLVLRDESVTTPFNLERLQAALPAETILLEFSSLGEELVCFVVESASAGGRIVPRRGLGTLAEAGRLAERLRFQLGKGVYGAEYLEQHLVRLRPGFDRVLGDLWRQLLAPLAADIAAARRLVIVAHGPLHGLPLHAAFDGERYLADKLLVSYAPSGRVFTACAERQHGPIVRPLFVGPRDEQLPWVTREVTELGHLYPNGETLVGRRATRAGLRRRSGRFDALHLAAHGQFRADNPRFSAVRLADGWLSVGDLAELCSGVSLVTLSACETGLNGLEAGEELVGLTRAVLGSGATSLLASLWTVHDRATYAFMDELYRGLLDGFDKAASLQRAMTAVRRQFDHPFFWAPFVLSGAI